MQRNLIRSFGVLPASQRIAVNVAKLLHKNATDPANRRIGSRASWGSTLPCSAMPGPGRNWTSGRGFPTSVNGRPSCWLLGLSFDKLATYQAYSIIYITRR